MGAMIAGGIVMILFGALATWGERGQMWWYERKLRRHTCPTPCSESYWCKCGCSGGWDGQGRETSCGVCGTQVVNSAAADITQEIVMPTPGQTTWGWRREKQERIQAAREWERKHGHR